MSQRLDTPKAKQQLRALFIKDNNWQSHDENFEERVMKLYDGLQSPATVRKQRKRPKYY